MSIIIFLPRIYQKSVFANQGWRGKKEEKEEKNKIPWACLPHFFFKGASSSSSSICSRFFLSLGCCAKYALGMQQCGHSDEKTCYELSKCAEVHVMHAKGDFLTESESYSRDSKIPLCYVLAVSRTIPWPGRVYISTLSGNHVMDL